MDLYDVAVARKLSSGGGGGGGSSDFSTAEVTISGAYSHCYGAWALSEYECSAYSLYSETGTFPLILYKGKGVIELNARGSISTSGAIELDEDNVYLVTGDCTITIS